MITVHLCDKCAPLLDKYQDMTHIRIRLCTACKLRMSIAMGQEKAKQRKPAKRPSILNDLLNGKRRI
jgi:hypothetical protein